MNFSPDPAEIATMANSAAVKRLYLSHFRVHMDSEDSHQKAMDDFAKCFTGECGIVEDLDVYDV